MCYVPQKCHNNTLQPNRRHDTVRKRHRLPKTRNSASKKTSKVKQPAIRPRPDDSNSERPLSNA